MKRISRSICHAVAEYTFQATVGQGRDFGTLEELAAARLIDPELASGSKRGYSYNLIVTRATAAGPSLFEVIARPLEYGKTGVRSFNMDYQVTIRDSYVKNARVSDMQPMVHECGSIECAETAAVSTLSQRTGNVFVDATAEDVDAGGLRLVDHGV